MQVSVGAGKTTCAASFLDTYTTPQWDPETGELDPGRAAVMAFPTNALLREVSAKLRVAHRVRVGVLAVLNADGSPACKKHTEATRLQAAGGDVHRLMCAGCEWKDGCPAIAGTTTGEGSLVLTNHALLPSVVREMHDAGRTPLIVWDETPPMVAVHHLRCADLDWVVDRFELEDRPQSMRGAGTLDLLDRPPIFGEQYRVALRPLLEVLRRVRAEGSVEAAVGAYAATRGCRSQLARAAAMFGVAVDGDPWSAVRAVAAAGKRVNVSERPFDAMAESHQVDVLRAERVRDVLDVIIRDDASVAVSGGVLDVVATTDHGALFRAAGGVVLDATAPLPMLLSLRPDARTLELNVKDADEVVRIVKPRGDLAKTRLSLYDPSRRAAVVQGVADDLAAEQAGLARRLGRPPKTLLLTYRSLLPDLAPLVTAECRYFGNIRGYDEWFQRGFDCFVTVGDPYSNVGDEAMVYCYLKVKEDFEEYVLRGAASELAQAHGRSRAVQPKRTNGVRLHLHYGRVPPLGWFRENTVLSP